MDFSGNLITVPAAPTRHFYRFFLAKDARHRSTLLSAQLSLHIAEVFIFTAPRSSSGSQVTRPHTCSLQHCSTAVHNSGELWLITEHLYCCLDWTKQFSVTAEKDTNISVSIKWELTATARCSAAAGGGTEKKFWNRDVQLSAELDGGWWMRCRCQLWVAALHRYLEKCPWYPCGRRCSG